MSYQQGITADNNRRAGHYEWNANFAPTFNRSRGTPIMQETTTAVAGWVALHGDERTGVWIQTEHDEWQDGWQGTWVANDTDTDATTAPDLRGDHSPSSSSMVSAWSNAWSNWSFGGKSHGNTTAVAGEGGQVLRAIATAVAGTGSSNAPGTNLLPLQDTSLSSTDSMTFDLRYFEQYVVPDPSQYKHHNEALKYGREVSEVEGKDVLVFSNTQPFPVPECVHQKGTAYHFDNDGWWSSWWWPAMIAQLSPDDIKEVVQGMPMAADGTIPQSRDPPSCITKCRLQKSDKYDHKRHHAGPSGKKEMMKIWDFVLSRDDGVEVFLHPNYSDTKVAMYMRNPGETDPEDHEIPASGMGGTSGRGTFRYFASKCTQKNLRFIVKAKAKGKGKGKGKLSSTDSSASTAVAVPTAAAQLTQSRVAGDLFVSSTAVAGHAAVAASSSYPQNGPA
jgi:hypothetical protein